MNSNVIIKYCDNRFVETKIELEGLNESKKIFLGMQVMNKNVKKKVHRFSKDESYFV